MGGDLLFSFTLYLSDRLWGPCSPRFNGSRGLFPPREVVKRPGRAADHSFPCNAEPRNGETTRRFKKSFTTLEAYRNLFTRMCSVLNCHIVAKNQQLRNYKAFQKELYNFGSV
jgi:hypothetical protein